MQGNTRNDRPMPCHLRNHPRPCGKCGMMTESAAVSTGSSPPTRGMHIRTDAARISLRLIPAHAGNTLIRLDSIKVAANGGFIPAYARSTSHFAAASRTTRDSSPPMRGILGIRLDGRKSIRFIPAHAGNILTKRSICVIFACRLQRKILTFSVTKPVWRMYVHAHFCG